MDYLDAIRILTKRQDQLLEQAKALTPLRRGIVIGPAPSPGKYYVAETGETATYGGNGHEYPLLRDQTRVPGTPSAKSNLLFLGAPPQISQTGNDLHGTVQMVTGGTIPSLMNTVAFSLGFSLPFDVTPQIFLSILNVGWINVSAANKTTTGFDAVVYPYTDPMYAGTYTFQYYCVAPDSFKPGSDVLIGDHSGSPAVLGELPY